jgi:hypothetical protein
MLINQELQLDFKDVLIQPQRSELTSRSQVDLVRTFKFKHSPFTWTGIPIIASNMTGCGTISMAKSLAKYKCMTSLHKHYDARNLIQFFLSGDLKAQERNEHPPGNTFYSMGITSKDVEKFEYVLSKTGYWNEEKANGIKMVLIEVANGYMESFVEFCKKFRDKHPNLIMMAGNVVTGDMTQELILNGADIIRAGIGGGCFVAESLVLTHNGLKPINEISVGEIVLTHKGNWQTVSNTFIYEKNCKLVSINGIKSTSNHEYYVVNKKYKDILNDENIHDYAKWVSAETLTKDYLLLKHKEK